MSGFIIIWLFLFLIGFIFLVYGRDDKIKILEASELISGHFIPGEGVSTNRGLNAAVNSKTGNCAQTAYIMARYLEGRGVHARLVGLVAWNGNNHLLTEAYIDKKWQLIDASNGVVYPHSAIEILQDKFLLEDMVGTDLPGNFLPLGTRDSGLGCC